MNVETQLTIVILTFFQIGIIIFNVGALLAYFQRNRLDTCKELFKRHLTSAILWGLPGILTLPGIALSTEKFRFGWRITKREDPKSRWWELVEMEYRKKEFRSRSREARRVEIPEGYCIDMWED